jgi:hypothetical protein
VPRGAEGIGIAQFQYDPDDAHGGFTSWHDFFTRRFRAGQRPDDTIIVSACEAIVLIEADDPTIGLVAFVPIGMSEVSS